MFDYLKEKTNKFINSFNMLDYYKEKTNSLIVSNLYTQSFTFFVKIKRKEHQNYVRF